MLGIKSYGAYVPQYRMNRNTIYSAIGFLGTFPIPGEKAVANHDEDSISMAVAAGIDCLQGIQRDKIDGLYLATTTQPYLVRQNSAIVAAALDLNSGIGTSDFVSCTKAGTSALIAALDAARREQFNSIIVCASDCRIGKPGGPLEHQYGDGASALLIGNNDLIASFEGHYSVSCDFPDRWRSVGEAFEHVWEDRFIRDEGYTKIIIEAISGLLNKYDLNIKDLSKIVYPCLYPREHMAIGKQLGAEAGQIQESILTTVGDTGTASSLMMLAAALEEAQPGDKIVVASYGSGSDAMIFQVTDKISEIQGDRGFRKHLAPKKELDSYEKYIAFRSVTPIDLGIRGEEIPFTQMSTLWRDRKLVFSLYGSKCTSCGTPQYPPQRVCVNPKCGEIDEMEDYRFSDRKASVFTFTGDNLASSIDPPGIYGVVDFEGGGRFWFDFTDCELEAISVGMPMEMTFRRKYIDESRGQHGYFWKAKPVIS